MTMQRKHGADTATEELRQDVDRARHELGETVEQLAAKADVKAMARETADYARERARDAAAQAWQVMGSSTVRTRAQQGGVVIASAGAATLTALWIRRQRRNRTRIGPIQVRVRPRQRRALRIRRRGGIF